ncbi:MAG TPA: dephospho-CoA kinase, partial [Acidimicrobiales bacterium]|nr:dephospho-CoA kinase [Acidimicrobiales bacterium]
EVSDRPCRPRPFTWRAAFAATERSLMLAGGGYVTEVFRVGLTGALGAGKSSVGKALGARGALVIDADEVAKSVLAPGTFAERAVLKRFGPRVAGVDGSLDRRALAAIVFADADSRMALEAITHPLIEQEVARRVASLETQAASAKTVRRGDSEAGSETDAGQGERTPRVAVIELPLLDRERCRRYGLDAVVLVEASEEVEVSRAVTDRAMSEGEARARLAAQPDPARQRAIADRVITNAGSRDELEAAVDELWSWLTAAAGARLKGRNSGGAWRTELS